VSKYMPYAVVKREYDMQQVRREYGLKSGTHVKWPDKEKGPYIILSKKASILDAIKAAAEKVDEVKI
jgi:hypothetical protein